MLHLPVGYIMASSVAASPVLSYPLPPGRKLLGSSITIMCSIPVWSMTFTAIFTPGSGSSNGMVVVVSICSHFSGSISQLNAARRFFRVLWFRPTCLTFISRARNDSVSYSVSTIIPIICLASPTSTTPRDDLIKALGCEGISKSQVSRICRELDVVVDGFMGRPLDGGPYPYLWLDALTQKVREDGRTVNVSVVVATAVNGEGKREIIGMDVGTSEDGAFWLAFLRSLSARGLSGVELVVSDAHQGLRGAIAAVFGGASWERCRTHFMTNLLTRVPRRAQPWVATMVRTIYQQPSPDEVHAQLDRVTDQLHDRFPQVASLLDEAGPDVLAFSTFPAVHWKKIWSNNPLERLNKEIRRRTDVVGIFPNRPAVRRLVGAVLAEQHDEWTVGRRYLTPAILTLNEALPEAGLAEATAA